MKKHSCGMLALWLLSFYGYSQNTPKQIYTSDLDSLWSRSTYINKITTNGEWVVLTEAFDHKKNLLMLKHTSDTINFILPESQWVNFSDNNRWFGCITANKELYLIDLIKHTKATYTNIKSYSFSKSGEFIAALQQVEDTEALLIMNLNNKSVNSIQAVNAFVWHPVQNSLLLKKREVDQNRIILYDVERSVNKVIKEKPNGNFNHLLWSDSGNTLVFTEQDNKEKLLNYYTLNGNLMTLDNVTIEKKFPDYKLGNLAPFISNNGKRILFYRELKNERNVEKETMEVWNSTDPWIYPRMKEYEEKELQSLMTAWYPDTNQLIAIETVDKPSAALNANHKVALVFDELQYEPLYKEFYNIDVYVKNLESGKEELIVQNQFTGKGFITMSPGGNYISYFKDSHWWVYDIEKNETVNLTKEFYGLFENFESDRAGDVPPYGNPGWTSNDKFLILYDQYDIWAMSPDGNYKQRMTKGREEKIRYRLNQHYNSKDYKLMSLSKGFSGQAFDFNKSLILDISDDSQKTGYAIWREGYKIKRLIFEKNKIDGIQISKDFKKAIFRTQRFDESPIIYTQNLKKKEIKPLYQSNRALSKYDIGKSQHVKYNIGDKMLSGSLLYPANFNPEKKYPMIVNIYEKMSNKVNDFNPPSYYDHTGFNILKYTTNGYFVLLPDISYTLQDPGISAFNCVTSAVNKVLELGFIDKDKIGLIGHSFGGYESAFIATQTDMFAAVVAGATVTNFTSHYHSVGWNWKKPEIWRYESQQWRMGVSYYDNEEAYFRNSPLHHIEKVSTPILIWSGKKDYQVHWTQSIELFLAMRRLKKESKLLLFENESHFLTNKKNQSKLSSEIFDWFEKYCK